MKIGACVGMGKESQFQTLKKIGYDYVEVGLWEISDADEAKRNTFLENLDKSGLKCEASAYAFPSVYNPSGAQSKDDIERAKDAFYRIIRYSDYYKPEILVIGAGGVRNFPQEKGYSLANVYEQLAQVCAEVISPIAQEFNLTVALEGLNKRESPTFNLTEQSVMTANQSGKANICVMTDYYHVFLEEEDMSKFASFGNKIVHAHIANPIGRIMPALGDGADYAAFFGALKNAGYNARLSVEAGIQGEFEPTMTNALEAMRHYAW